MKVVRSVTVNGYSPWRPDELGVEFLKKGHLADAPGDFVCAIDYADSIGEPALALASSSVATQPYFFTVWANKLIHGPNVLDVACRAGLSWS